jgi:hypothetical protein
MLTRSLEKEFLMDVRRSLLAVALAGSFAAPLGVQAAVNIDVDNAPPAAIVEEAPARPGYVYTPGYWRWDEPRHNHIWIKGEYVPERRGEHWVGHEWREQNGRYHFNEGRWERDKGQ